MNMLAFNMFVDVSLGIYNDLSLLVFPKWYDVELFFQIIVFHIFTITLNLTCKNVSNIRECLKLKLKTCICYTELKVLFFKFIHTTIFREIPFAK